MNDPFFISPASAARKRKPQPSFKGGSQANAVTGKKSHGPGKGNHPNKRAKKGVQEESEASGSDSDADIDNMDLEASDIDENASDSDNGEDAAETAQEKRIRLAKRYLEKVQQDVARQRGDEVDDGEFDAAAIDRSLVSERLRDEALELVGRLHRDVAAAYKDLPVSEETIKSVKGHTQSVTCVAVTPDEKYVYSGSKDGSIIKCKLGVARAPAPVTTERKD
jgi:ribosomal RNA-processing protein 9